MTTNKKEIKSNALVKVNVLGLGVLLLLGGMYLYQVSSLAGLEYQVEEKRAELDGVEQEYRELDLNKNQNLSLDYISDRKEELELVEVASPSYLLEPQKEFARRD